MPVMRIMKTTISVHKATKTKLESLGKKGESFDELVKRLIETIEK